MCISSKCEPFSLITNDLCNQPWAAISVNQSLYHPINGFDNYWIIRTANDDGKIQYTFFIIAFMTCILYASPSLLLGEVRDKGVTVPPGSNWERVMQLQLISWSETHPFLPLFLSPSRSEELFPCEQQRTLQTPPVLSAGQRLLQQAAVDHLSAPGHRALARQDGSDQPVAALPSRRSRPVSHSRAQPQLGHRNGRPYQSLTVGLISRRSWGFSIHLYIDIRENERLSVRDDCA